MPAVVTYSDIITKETVEQWGESLGFGATGQIRLHFELVCPVELVEITAAVNHGEFLELAIVSKRWEGTKEFGLLSSGSLVWS